MGMNKGVQREFNEAEIQALIAMIELFDPVDTPNNASYSFFPKSLEEAARYFLSLRLDWGPAFSSLASKGCIEERGGEYRLNDSGAAAARILRKARPPIYYWYEEFYREAPASPAFAAYCEALYGRALCQDGFSDMGQVDRMLEASGVGPGCRLLDLGCGPGMISGYIRRATGARVTGMDYSPRAIALARERTETETDGLSFVIGNLDDMPFEDASFDVAIAIDSLYMPNDLRASLRRLAEVLSPEGRIAAYYTHMIASPERRAELQAERTPLGLALRDLGLGYRAIDVSRENHGFLRRKRRVLESLRDGFEREGRSFLYGYLYAQSEGGDAPYDPAESTMSRYLYLIEQ